MYNAFYYEDNYYLLPEAFSTYEELVDALHNSPLPFEIQAVALREDHKLRNYSVTKGRSMAPYFLSGYHDIPRKFMITNAEDVYPAKVEVYSQEEYNAKLREIILKTCPGCLRYKPLSNRVQSLNGHFEEMGLDGVCLFRQETKPSPRVFRDHLFSFGGFYLRSNFFVISAAEMLDKLKWLYVRYADAKLCDLGAEKELTLTGKKKELLLPVVTQAISEYVEKISGHAYHIRFTDPVSDIKSWLRSVVTESNKEAFQKECKKYGVSFGVLHYAPHSAEKVRKSLKPLLDHFWMFPLLQEEGTEYYLLADTANVLKELRYRSPLLQTYQAQMDVFGQYGNTHYGISFDMPCTKE